MVDGVREGFSCYSSLEDGTKEEITFTQGMPEGSSRLVYGDGSVEERIFKDGSKNGPASLKGSQGDVFTFTYAEDVMQVNYYLLVSATSVSPCSPQGPSKYQWSSGRWEESTYVMGAKQGQGLEVS